MARRNHKSKIAKWGNSLAVRIPQAVAAALGLSNGSEVKIAMRDQSLTIRKMKHSVTLDELLEGVTPRNSGGEIDSGAPIGREIW